MWVFLQKSDMDGLICGGRYGCWSNSRPGGSGLKDHLNKNKYGYGKEWEVKKWKELLGNWDQWSGSYNNAFVIK